MDASGLARRQPVGHERDSHALSLRPIKVRSISHLMAVVPTAQPSPVATTSSARRDRIATPPGWTTVRSDRMRIAIDYRITALPRDLMTRGIPRYTQQQLREVLRIDRANEYILLSPDRGDRDVILPEIRRAPNVTVQPFPWSAATRAARPDDPSVTLRKTEELQQWIVRERIDLYHHTAVWLSTEVVMPAIDACPVVATVFDLIPLLFPEDFTAFGLMDLWWSGFDFARTADRLIAISDFTRREVVQHMRVPTERIDVAHPVADPVFRPMPVTEARRRLAELPTAIPDRFVLAVTFMGATKNLDTLLRAYASIPAARRRRLPLVTVGFNGPPVGSRLRASIKSAGIEGEVIVTGTVSDEQLAALYNAAALFVCPSRYEGFGMPVLEAMQCGTPVLTTTASALPEVAGEAAHLVAPDDEEAFAHAIEAIASDEDRRAAMRAASLERARAFPAEALGRTTLAAYEGTAAERPRRPTRPRAALWTPFPPQTDRVARRGLELADALASTYDVEVFVGDGLLPDRPTRRRHRVRHHTAFERRHAQAPFDLLVYQPGSAANDIAASAAERWPGVVVLHDAEVIARLTPALANATMIVVHTDAVRRALPTTLAAKTRVLPAGVADLLGTRPALEAESARARLQVAPSTFVIGVVETSWGKDAAICLRAIAELVRTCPHVCLIFLEPDTPAAAIKTITGDACALGLDGRVRWLDHAVRADVDEALLACDVVVAVGNRDSSRTPFGLLRAAAASKPAVTSDLPSWRIGPADASIRLPPGPRVAESLAAALRTLAFDPRRREAMGMAARAAYEADGTLEQMGRAYRDLVNAPIAPPSSAPASTAPGRRPLAFNKACEIEDFDDPEFAALMRDVLEYKAHRFGADFPHGVEHNKDWEVTMAVRALRQFGALRPDARLLGVAAGTEDTTYYLTRHVREVTIVDRYLQPGVWGLNAPTWMLASPGLAANDRCDVRRLAVEHSDARRLRFADETFDGIFSSGSIEHFGGLDDVAHAAYEMGRVLKPGGVLSMSTVVVDDEGPTRIGWPGSLLMFRHGDLARYIVEASGLELVDPLETTVSNATMQTRRSLALAMADHQTIVRELGAKGESEAFLHWDFPHVALDYEGFTFHSMHLTLRKTDRYPIADNAWARPTPELDADLVEARRLLVEQRGGWEAMPGPPLAANGARRSRVLQQARHLARTRNLRARARHLHALAGGWESELRRRASRSGRAVSAPLSSDRAITIRRHGLPPYVVMIDPTQTGDLVADVYAAGLGGSADRAEIDLLLALVAADDVVIDVGAHIGTVALPLAAAGCEVLAIEASPTNARLLRAGVVRNGFRRVHVVEAAADAVAGRTPFVPNGAWGQLAAWDHPYAVSVPAVRVDDLIDAAAYERVALVKLDVEGAELRAIEGMSRLLARSDAPVVFYESNGHTLASVNATPGDLVGAFESRGYRCFALYATRLAPVTPTSVQPRVVENHVAVKGEVPAAIRARMRGPLTPREWRRLVASDASSALADSRRHVARVLERAPADLLRHRHLARMLDALARDRDESVRQAAAWWTRSPRKETRT
jgi:FkbM family methyltransferase